MVDVGGPSLGSDAKRGPDDAAGLPSADATWMGAEVDPGDPDRTLMATDANARASAPAHARISSLGHDAAISETLSPAMDETLGAAGRALEGPTGGGPALNDGMLETMASADGGAPRRSERVTGHGGDPDKIGRHHILRRLGAGGMGVVYAAFDPELDRKIALKLVLPAVAGSAGGEAQQRLLREAQAMARLSDPHIVQIFDVGTHEGQVYIAMEFIEGRTLGDWLKLQTRTWREVVEIFRQAGEGLATAHAAGLVHRDFKPDNVLVGVDGRARVMDFGLARAVESDAGPPIEAGPEGTPSAGAGALRTGSHSALDLKLTRAGAVMGTPRYMAPEQFEGAETDARTDQFSFCVALYEALVGRPPFEGENFHALALAVTGTTPVEFPRGAHVPGHLERALVRGLARTPAQRFADMRALLEPLGRDPTRTRRNWALGVGFAAAAGGWGLSAKAPPPPPDPCPPAEAAWAETWPERAGQVRSAFEATKLAYAQETFDEVDRSLRDYGEAWQAAGVDACRATRVEGRQSSELLDRRTLCLQRQRRDVGVLVDSLATIDAQSLPKAREAVANLPPVAECDASDALMAEVLPPSDPEQRERVETLREEIARAKVLHDMGKLGESLDVIQGAHARAVELKYPPLQVEADYFLGNILTANQRYEEAVPILEASTYGALAVGDRRMAVLAPTVLGATIGYFEAKPDEGLAWTRLAEATLERFGAESAEGARVLSTKSLILARKSEGDESWELGLAALELRKRVLGDEHPHTGFAHLNVGVGAISRQKLDLAWEELQAARRIVVDSLGYAHPHVPKILNAMSVVARMRGDTEGALQIAQESLTLQEHVWGPDHPETANALVTLAGTHVERGEFQLAYDEYERARALRLQAMGPDHADTALTEINLGHASFGLGRIDEAEAHLRAGLATTEATVGGESEGALSARHGLGRVAAARGEHERAVEIFGALLADRRRILGAEHLGVGETALRLAESESAVGKARSAKAHAEIARTIFSGAGGAESRLAEADALLARLEG